jgi:tRNA nucleotidyltransferase/poly(A) polymerase
MPDYMYQLESRLSPEQRAVMMRVQELGQEVQLNVYLTGGAVRDLISGMAIRDLDFTVEGNPSRMVREMEKGGARAVYEDEKTRHWEFIFLGDVDGSIEEAREDFYDAPGSKPEIRWASITDDLRRRDFSVNAIAISLNQASRGLLLDPMNGLADLERKEVRALSIHSFTNQPVRLLRAIFYCARLGLKLEQRTAESFDLALSRELQESIDGPSAGLLVRQLTREENPAAVLKAWDSRKLLGSLSPALGRRKPNLGDFARLAKAREGLWGAGVRPRLFATAAHYLVDRLGRRDQTAAMKHWGFSAAEIAAVENLPAEAHKFRNLLQGRKMRASEDAYRLLVQTSPNLLAFVLTEWSTSGAAMRIRNYLTKWHPLRLSLPVAELSALGISPGPKFDEVIEEFFVMQLRGKARNPEERPKILKKLAGIKDEPPKKAKPDKGRRKEKNGAPGAPQVRNAGAASITKAKPEVQPAGAAKPEAKTAAITGDTRIIANSESGPGNDKKSSAKKGKRAKKDKTGKTRKRASASRKSSSRPKKTRKRSVSKESRKGAKTKKSKKKGKSKKKNKRGKKRGGKRG